MAQKNTERIEHELETLPNTFRKPRLEDILNDIDEESTGKGFSETTYVGGNTPFIQKIETYKTSSKQILRSEVRFTYSPLPFVSQIEKDIMNEEGTAVVVRITAAFTYNTNKTLKDVEVTQVRL